MPTRLHTRQLHKDFPVSRKRRYRSHTIRLSFFNAFSTVSDQVLSEFLSNRKTVPQPEGSQRFLSPPNIVVPYGRAIQIASRVKDEGCVRQRPVGQVEAVNHPLPVASVRRWRKFVDRAVAVEASLRISCRLYRSRQCQPASLRLARSMKAESCIERSRSILRNRD